MDFQTTGEAPRKVEIYGSETIHPIKAWLQMIKLNLVDENREVDLINHRKKKKLSKSELVITRSFQNLANSSIAMLMPNIGGQKSILGKIHPLVGRTTRQRGEPETQCIERWVEQKHGEWNYHLTQFLMVYDGYRSTCIVSGWTGLPHASPHPRV